MSDMRRVMTGKSMSDLPEMLDGATGQDEIFSKFKEVHEKLYNCSESSSEMNAIDERIKDLMKSQNNKVAP